jgi:hypothetical protein
LRENGRYIAPSGSSDVWAAVAVVLRNLIAVHVVLAVTVVTALLGGVALRFVPAMALDAIGLTAEVRDLGFLSLSPWLVVPALSVLLVCLPAGIAYWLVGDRGERGSRAGWPSWLTVVFVLAGTSALAVRGFRAAAEGGAPDLLVPAATATAALMMLLALVAWALAAAGRTPAEARNLLTGWLRTGLVVTSAGIAFAAVDSIGESLYRWVAELPSLVRGIAAAFGAVAATAAAAQKFIGPLAASGKGRIAIPLGALAMLGAIAVAGTMLCGLSAVAHGLAAPDDYFLWYAFGAGLALTLTFGHTYPFLNRSTLADLYGARLTRAYLGASNESRRQPRNQTITRLLKGDQIAFPSYAPHRFGGPLHIINVTLNETVSGQSQIEQRDRRGMNMAIGPAGVSVAARHHALWNKDRGGLTTTDPDAPADRFMIFPPAPHAFAVEPLTVGQWVAVSGAAVSPGLGWRTSLGLSILIGLLNLRLGRWWGSGIDPRSRERAGKEAAGFESTLRKLGRLVTWAFPVQAHLLEELLARFHGPARQSWYLTDGGHFENTGAYELIRRGLPVMIVCDHGADGEGAFTDLADLVRKVRTDFGAEVRFLNEAERTAALQPLADPAARTAVLSRLGDLEDIGFGRKNGQEDAAAPAGDRRFAALAEIAYLDGSKGYLVLVKPRVTAALPVDLREYQLANRDFPQQSTGDQFFDERQWESHRKLGFEIGDSLFGTAAGFWPSALR